MKKSRIKNFRKRNIVDYKQVKAGREATYEQKNVADVKKLLKPGKRHISYQSIFNRIKGFYRFGAIMFVTGFVFVLVELGTGHRPVSMISPVCFGIAVISWLISLLWLQEYMK